MACPSRELRSRCSEIGSHFHHFPAVFFERESKCVYVCVCVSTHNFILWHFTALHFAALQGVTLCVCDSACLFCDFFVASLHPKRDALVPINWFAVSWDTKENTSYRESRAAVNSYCKGNISVDCARSCKDINQDTCAQIKIVLFTWGMSVIAPFASADDPSLTASSCLALSYRVNCCCESTAAAQRALTYLWKQVIHVLGNCWIETTRIHTFCLISTIIVKVHGGFVNRIASLRKREVLLFNGFGWNREFSESKALVRCEEWVHATCKIFMHHRQDLMRCMKDFFGLNPAPQAKFFCKWSLMDSLSSRYDVINWVFSNQFVTQFHQQLRILFLN